MTGPPAGSESGVCPTCGHPAAPAAPFEARDTDGALLRRVEALYAELDAPDPPRRRSWWWRRDAA